MTDPPTQTATAVSRGRGGVRWFVGLAVVLVVLGAFVGGLEYMARKTCCDAEARAALAGLLQRSGSAQAAAPTSSSSQPLELNTPPTVLAETTPVLEAIMDRPPGGGPPFFRFRPHTMIGPNLVTNNLGLAMDHDIPIAKPPGVVRVVTLGASTTQGALQVPGYRYPAVLQRLLNDNPATANWEVINAGHQGWGVRDVAESLRTDILPLDPDILIYYGEINDVAGIASGVYGSANHPFPEGVVTDTLTGLRTQSKLWSYYLAPKLDPVLPWTGSIAEFNWTELLKPWVSGVQDILDTAHERGIKVVLVTYAYAVQDGQRPTDPMLLYMDQGGWPAMKDPIRQFRQGVAAENEILRLMADERHVPVVQAAEQLDGRLELFNDTVHMTPQGYAQLARLVAAGLTNPAKPPAVPGSSARPSVSVAYDPSSSAAIGRVVHIEVTAAAPVGNLAGVQLAVNRAADGSANGDWDYLGSPNVSGKSGSATFEWDTSGLAAGDHRVAVNIQLEGGDMVWWYQQPSRMYHLLAAQSGSQAPARPAVTDVRYLPNDAVQGQPVTIEVDADGGGSQISTLQVAVNTAADGTATGDWIYLGTTPVTGSTASSSYTWDTTGIQPGDHLVAVNLMLADGRTEWWYQQPPRKYVLK